MRGTVARAAPTHEPLAGRLLGGLIRAACAWVCVLPGVWFLGQTHVPLGRLLAQEVLTRTLPLVVGLATLLTAAFLLEARRGVGVALLWGLYGLGVGTAAGPLVSAAASSVASSLHPALRGEAFLEALGAVLDVRTARRAELLAWGAGPTLLLVLALRTQSARLGPALAAGGLGGLALAIGPALTATEEATDLPVVALVARLVSGLGLALGAWLGDRLARCDPARARPERERDPGRVLALGLVALVLLGLPHQDGGHYAEARALGAQHRALLALRALRANASTAGPSGYARSLTELYEAGLVPADVAEGLAPGYGIRLRADGEGPGAWFATLAQPLGRLAAPGVRVFYSDDHGLLHPYRTIGEVAEPAPALDGRAPAGFHGASR